MAYLIIEVDRSGYTPEQAEDWKSTLTVGELRQVLEDYDDDTKIYLSNDNGYTYGSISYEDFSEQENEEEEEEEEEE